jgi:hypothetical protein
MGFSTYIGAQMFIDTVNTPNTQSIIIAQDETSSKRLFQMIKRFYDNLPQNKKPRLGTDSKTELFFRDIESYFFVGWAGSKRLGRGSTINNIHFSEAAFYEDGGALISGLTQSVPPDGNVFMESTANGVGNYFHKEYKDAQAGNSIFTDRFFPWFTELGYQSNFLIGGGSMDELDPDELRLVELYDLTIPQLIWRRNKILELRRALSDGNTALGTFPQEYPSNPDEAFISTGSQYFDQKVIAQELRPRIQQPLPIEPPVQYGTLRREVRNYKAQIKFWSLPIAGRSYLISADPSEGLNTEGDHDYCSSDIIDVETWEQVGHLHGRWEPHEFAQLLSDTGQWFNTALIVVERNNHGHSVLNTLINVCGYPKQKGYTGVYEYVERASTGKAMGQSKPGIPTNVKTKVLMLSALYEAAMELSLIINCNETLDQMLLFVKKPGGKLEASSGHDDRVMSLAIASFVLKDVVFNKRINQSPTRAKPVTRQLFKKGSRFV